MLLSVHRVTGSFASAGAAAAADTTAFAVSSLLQGRLVDCRGPGVLAAVTVVSAVAIAAMNIALIAHARPAVLIGVTGLDGG